MTSAVFTGQQCWLGKTSGQLIVQEEHPQTYKGTFSFSLSYRLQCIVTWLLEFFKLWKEQMIVLICMVYL